MMIAYEFHRPRAEDNPAKLRHELILQATDEADVMRLMALVSMYSHGVLERALDQAIALLAEQEIGNAHEEDQGGTGEGAEG